MAQKQLHNLPPSCWEEDLKQAQLCLDTLEYCGTMDQVALRYHLRLFNIFNDLAGPSSPHLTTLQRTEDWVTMPPDFPPLGRTRDAAESSANYPPPDYLITTPPSANKRLSAIARPLLDALCSPFGDPTESRATKSREGSQLRGSVDREKQAWGISQEKLPFSWDTSGLGLKPSNDIASDNRFVGSESPNGWVPAAEVDDEGVEEDV